MAKSIQPVDRLVGQNIRIFRNAKKLSQTDLGNAVGISFQQIQKYERGTNRVGSSRLAQIAEILEVPVARFFDNAAGGADGPVAGQIVTDLLGVRHAVPMLKAFARISSDGVRRSLVSLAESIAKYPKG